MRRVVSVSAGIAWRVALVSVKALDGPHRVEVAYRILLTPNNLFRPVSQGAGLADLRGHDHANRHLRPSLDRASGA